MPDRPKAPRTLRGTALALAGLLLVVFVLVGLAMHHVGKQGVEDKLERQLLYEHAASAACLETRLAETLSNLRVWARQAELTEFLESEDPPQAQELIDRIWRELSSLPRIDLLDCDGRRVAKAGAGASSTINDGHLGPTSSAEERGARLVLQGGVLAWVVPVRDSLAGSIDLGYLVGEVGSDRLLENVPAKRARLLVDESLLAATASLGERGGADALTRSRALRLPVGAEGASVVLAVGIPGEEWESEMALLRFRVFGLTGSAALMTLVVLLVFLRSERRFMNRLRERADALEEINFSLVESEAGLREETERFEAAGRAKDEFLANMSHEIRTPMNGVIGMAELLMDTELGDDQREFVETIQTSGAALLQILNDVLDLSKIEAGKMMLESIDFELSNVVDDVLELLAERAYGKGLEIANFVDDKIPRWLRGDPTRFRQILLNLLSNAVKFTEEGRVTLRAQMLEHVQGEVRVRFEVSDTGIGITSEAASKLFQSFSQADASTTRRYGGSGLGLAISRRLVETMEGRIGLRSREGQGSTFWFELPFRSSQRIQGPATVSQSSLRKLRVLYVDDHAARIEVAQHVLEPEVGGLRCEQRLKDALELLRDTSNAAFDLVLLDLEMSDAGQNEAPNELVLEALNSPIPVIVVTSRRTQRRALLGQGATAVLFKPLRRGPLVRSMTEVLGLGQRDATVAGNDNAQKALDLAVLLVEDNPVNRKVIGTMLRRLGCEVEYAGNGREAVELHALRNFNLIVMDCQMPVMDGYEATAAIRQRESASDVHTPILALTANAMKGTREECLAAGMDDYLTKPVRLDALEETLARWRPVLNKS